MALFPSASRQALPKHAHTAEEACPWCDQPITHDKFEEIMRRMTAEQDERIAALTAQHEQEKASVSAKAQAAVERARQEAALAAEQKLALARTEAKQAAETVATAKLAEIQARLAATEQEKAAAQARMTALAQEQEALVAQRLEGARQALQKERDAAVLAEKAKAFDETQRLQLKLQDLQRQLEGKSAHELGEGSEIDLFEQLKSAFEGDRIVRVGKGVNGADVIHEVIHNGQVCGKIIYDAKNRNAWQNEFVNKLRADKIAEGADHAILSSNKFPKEKQQVHPQDGVIVAHPARVPALAEILRGQIVRMHALKASAEERGQKTGELYAFITSEHFKQLIDQVETQSGKMLELDTKEQEAHRRLWDNRAKLIRSVQKARSDLSFEIDRIIGTAGNGPDDEGEAAA